MKRSIAALLLLACACTSSPPDVARPTTSSPTPSASPQPSPSPSPPVTFDAARAVSYDRYLVERIGRREATTTAYRRAADYTATVFASFGYRVERQKVQLPKGTIEKVPVPAGPSQNVVAYPPGYDPAKRHLVVGAHLDTVPVTAGANDNGSGAAAILELARVAAASPPRLPIVFVEFTAEERRYHGSTGAMFGSRHYLASLSRTERATIAGVLIVDMIGNGPVTLVCRRSASSSRRLLDAVLGNARRLKLPARENLVTQFFSDHVPFETAGIPVAWLWSGEHPTVHKPSDTMAVIKASDVGRSGRIAWETLRVYS